MRKWQAGISLLEVLVTVLIVTGGLVVVMASFVGIAKSNRYVEKMETANSLLRLEMETLRNDRFVDIISSDSDYGNSFLDQPDFRRVVEVTDLGNVKRVRVRILFDSDRHQAEATTMVAQL
ncbi:type II secretion system protein [bacterium]|nr:type II secretion system protein [bacterium]